MSFPLPYFELQIPKAIIKILVLIGFLHRLISSCFNVIHTPLLGPPANPDRRGLGSISSTLIKQMLPSIRFEDLPRDEEEIDKRLIADGCAICLSGFETSEEIRTLSNCRHVFHLCCIDQWIELYEKSCPLCRKLLVSKDILEALD